MATTRNHLAMALRDLREFAATASVTDLQQIADVAEDLAIDAEERQEDRLASAALKKWKPQAGDVIRFKREGNFHGIADITLHTGTVGKTPEKGSRRIQIRPGNSPDKSHIMIKRIVGVVSRADAKTQKGSKRP